MLGDTGRPAWYDVGNGGATENEQLDNASVCMCMDGVMEATVSCGENVQGEPFDDASE